MFGCVDKPAEKHGWLICCERKILFRLKNKLKKTDYKLDEQGQSFLNLTPFLGKLINIFISNWIYYKKIYFGIIDVYHFLYRFGLIYNYLISTKVRIKREYLYSGRKANQKQCSICQTYRPGLDLKFFPKFYYAKRRFSITSKCR
jgi:hypothetical protein